jgi:hypothetical protein
VTADSYDPTTELITQSVDTSAYNPEKICED